MSRATPSYEVQVVENLFVRGFSWFDHFDMVRVEDGILQGKTKVWFSEFHKDCKGAPGFHRGSKCEGFGITENDSEGPG